MYRRSSLAILPLLTLAATVAGAPLTRSRALSALFSQQSGPILSPYFYVDSDKTIDLVDALKNPGLTTATISFGTAVKGQVGFLMMIVTPSC
jgi:hypothetical protein